VREFEREEQEQVEENWFGHDDDDDDDDDDDRAAHAMPVHATTSDVPLSVLHAMLTQGRLVHDLLEGSVPYFDSWGRISEAQHYVAPPSYTEAELMQLN
jgi:hypothetical protein